MEEWKIIEVIEILAWPFCALVFGIIFLNFFKEPITNFISRVKSVGKKGVTTDTPKDTQISENENKYVEELMSVVEASPMLIEVENELKTELREKDLDYTGDASKILLRHLAATKIGLIFERTYQYIFGSQIELLKQLNNNNRSGFTRKEIDGYFHNLKTIHVDFKDWETDNYIQFLLDASLIVTKNDIYVITVRGVEFLLWLIKNSRNENKLL